MSSNIGNIMMNPKIQESQPMDGEKRTIRITTINNLNNYYITNGNKSENGKKRFNTNTNYQNLETNINDDKIKTIENSNYTNKRIYFKVTKNNSTIKSKTNNSSKSEIFYNQNNKELQFNTNEERLYKYKVNSNDKNDLIKSTCSNLKYKSNTSIPNKNRVANQNILLNGNIIQDLNTFVYNSFNDNNLYKSYISENQFNILNQPISPLTLEQAKFKKVKNIQKKSKIKEIKYNSSNKLPQKIKRTNQNYFCQTDISENLDKNLYNRPKEILQTDKDKKTLDPDNNNNYKFNYIYSQKYNTLLIDSANNNNNYIYDYLPINITNEYNYNRYESMLANTKENKRLLYQYLPTNSSVEIYKNEDNTASPSLKANLKEINNNFQKKENKKTISHKNFQSFDTYNSGKSRKVSLVIKNNAREQKVKEIQNCYQKTVTGKTEEIYDNYISNDITENKQIKTCNSTKNERLIGVNDNKPYFETIINNRKQTEFKNNNGSINHHTKTEIIGNHNDFQKVEEKVYDYNLYHKNSFYDENMDKIIKNNSFGNSNNIINKTLTNKEKSVIINKKRNINLNSNKLNDMNLIIKQNLIDNTINNNIKKYNKSNPNFKTEKAVNNYINKKFNKVLDIIDKNKFCNIKTCFKLWKNKSEKFNNIKKIDAKISELKNKLNNIDIWKKNKMNHFNIDNKKDKTLSSDILKNKRKIMTFKTMTYYENKNFYKSNVSNNKISNKQKQNNINKYNNSNNNNDDINNGNSITPQLKKIIDNRRIANIDLINGNLNSKGIINNKKNTFKTMGNSFKSVNINKKNNIELINNKMVLGRLNNMKNREARITKGFKKIHLLYKNSKFRSKKMALKKIKDYVKINKRTEGIKKIINLYIKYKKSKIKKAFAKIRKYFNKNKRIERIINFYNYLKIKIKFNKKYTFRVFKNYVYSIKKRDNAKKIYNFLVKIVKYHKKATINKLKHFSNNKKQLQNNNKISYKNTNVISISSNKQNNNNNNNINLNELNSNNNVNKSIGKKFLNNQIDSTTYSIRIQPTNNIHIITSSPKESSCFTLINKKSSKSKTKKLEDLFDDSCNPWTINIEKWEVNQTENDSFYQSKNNNNNLRKKNKSNGLLTFSKTSQKISTESSINGNLIQQDEKCIPNINGREIESFNQNKEGERKKRK